MKDAQGQVYWQWCRAADFGPAGDARWDATDQALSLISHLAAPPPPATLPAARNAANTPPIAVDAFGSWARVIDDGSVQQVVAGGAGEPEIPIFTAPPGSTIHDLAPTEEGHLFIALTSPGGPQVIVHDRLARFDDVGLVELGFAPDRVVVSAAGPVWALDRGGRAVRQIRGAELDRRVAARARAAYVFQPQNLNPDPLRFASPADLDLSPLPEILDAAALPDGRLAILTIRDDLISELYVCGESVVDGPIGLTGLRGAFSLAIYGADKLAFVVPDSEVAVATPLPGAGDALPLLGLNLPLRRGNGGRLCKLPPGEALVYAATPVPTDDDLPAKPFARLVSPSRPCYARCAQVSGITAEADAPRTVWHRIYLEAHIPQACGVTVLLAAGDDQAALAALPLQAMHAHRFGATGREDGPLGVWRDFDSEKPFLASATGQPRKKDRCGLFTALVQGGDGPVKRIRGRFLRIELILNGSGLATPRLHAMRIWGPRAAWRDRYLPDYLSVEEGPLAAGSDFLDRYLAIFEALFTPLEDQVAQSWRLTRPESTPADALDWLASWIGAELDQTLSETAKRRLLKEAIPIWRRRGTLPGLRKMLEIVTDGGISRGEIVVMENYHLRRTFSTILGAELSDYTNPLTPWASTRGNSHLGATFFLGVEDEKAFFALFRPELLGDPLTTAEERQAALDDLQEFFDQHAHRVTIVIHGEMDEETRDLISRVVVSEVPAHVQTEIVQGPGSLVLALSSLLAVDTRFGPPPPRQDLSLGGAQINQAFLTDTPSLDPRFEGGS